MQAIEFETVTKNHLIKIPEHIPDGISIRVLLLVNDKIVMQKNSLSENSELKTLLTSVMEGLEESDFERPRDFGREQPEWGF
jgi:hypothetical protein